MTVHSRHSLAILFMPVLRMVFDTVDVLVALFASRYRTSERLLIRPVWRRRSASVPHDELGAKLLGRPRFIAVF